MLEKIIASSKARNAARAMDAANRAAGALAVTAETWTPTDPSVVLAAPPPPPPTSGRCVLSHTGPHTTASAW